MRSDKDRILDILEAVKKIEKYAAAGRDRFYSDELVQVWMTQQIQIIGEAASRLSDELKENHPEISWEKIIAMRNILVHSYFKVDPDEIWAVIIKDIPEIKPKINALPDVLPDSD